MSTEFWLGLVIGITVGEVMQMLRQMLVNRLEADGRQGEP
jgi:ABC-type uncharacterized transport system permease subunit